MATITSATVKRLFARCQNRCAFPSCEAPIIEDSDTVTGDICHIKAASVGGPRYDASQTDEARHGAANLILLCTRHHRIVDADIEKHTTSVLIEMKRKHEQGGVVEITPRTARAAESLLAHYAEVTVYSNSGQIAVNSPGAVQANTLTLKVSKQRVIFTAPSGSIGSDQAKTSYIAYLIGRYQEFQKGHASKTDRFKYIAIHAALKRELKGEWKLLSVDRFGEVVEFLHRRIDNTLIGKENKSKGIVSFHLFSEHG